MSYFGIPLRNGVPIGLGSIAGFGVAPAFDPSELFSAGEQGAWYDPSDLTTLFQDSAGTTPVTAVEQFVGRMNDKSGRGNHATQTTSAKRPKLAARYNLLTYTEQFDNAAWGKDNCTVSANATVAPDGTSTADKVVSAAATTATGVGQATTVTATTYTASIYAKIGEARYIQLLWNTPASTNYANFDLQLGTVTAGTYISATITNVGNGWYRLTITSTLAAGNYNFFAWLQDTGTAVRGASYTGNGTNGLFVWGADLRPASQATGLIGPTYQRVVDAATYDTVGFLPYLEFNGLSWSMSTGSIDFTATDKMTVWAGVRKLSDAAICSIMESVANYTIPGGYGIFAPVNAASPTYSFGMTGTTGSQVGQTSSSYAAPVTNVLTARMDIAQLLYAGLTARVNGAAATLSYSGAGVTSVGTFANAALCVGARGNTSFFFNGWLTSLIVRGAQSTQSQIEATESWVNQRTGAY